jgi:hypothetical protein
MKLEGHYADFTPVTLPIGYFSRGRIAHTAVDKDAGYWKGLIERAEDKATFWSGVTIFAADRLETRDRESSVAVVECKLFNMFQRFEVLVVDEAPEEITESRGMFPYAVNLNPAITKSEFLFLEPIVQETFARFAEAYGFEVA